MGCCQSENSLNLTNSSPRTINSKFFKSNTISIPPDYGDDRFKDFPEWEGNRYRGVGIKRMKGYKCTLPIDELLLLREDFWSFQRAHDNIWRDIRQAVAMDEYRSNIYLNNLKLTTVNGCINHLIDKNGKHYFIPNYCINDPYFEKNFDNVKEKEEQNIELILFETSLNVEYTFTVSNFTTGKKLKEIFAEKAELDLNKCKLRIFFAGNEIKDEHKLFQHGLNNNYKLQIMKIEL